VTSPGKGVNSWNGKPDRREEHKRNQEPAKSAKQTDRSTQQSSLQTTPPLVQHDSAATTALQDQSTEHRQPNVTIMDLPPELLLQVFIYVSNY
jgi:hypothetical protein